MSSSSDKEECLPSLIELFEEKNENVKLEDVQAVIKQYPDALKEKDNDGSLPLHIATMDGASVEVIQLLINKYPDAVEKKDNDGYLPLHHAITCATVEVIQLLIEKYPYAVREKDKHGKMLLHYSVLFGASVEVIQLLIKVYPDALKEKDEDRKLPLHYATMNGASARTDVIQLLVKVYPDALKEKAYGAWLPLHYATMNGASVEAIQLLIEKYPDAVREKDKHGKLLLHYSVLFGASVEVIQLLMKVYPDALKEKDEDGKLPLHYATKNGASADVIQLLIEKYPHAVREKVDGLVKEDGAVEKKDEYGYLPLHYAAMNGASVEVIQLLIEKYPDAVREKDYDVDLPLHYATKNGASVEVIDLLIDYYPDAVKKKDKHGNLPLHIAARYGVSVEVIELLIDKYPDALKEKDGDGKLPLHYAIGRNDAEGLVLALLKADMPVSEDGKPVEHCGSWFTCVSSDSEIAKDAVRQVLLPKHEGGSGFGEYIHALANVRDAEDNTALSGASKEARHEIYKYLLFCNRYKLHIGPPEHRTATSVLLRAQDLDEKANYGAIFDNVDINKDGNLDKNELNSIEIAESIGLDPDLFLKSSDKKTISKAAFVAICKRELGDGPREVVIKLMQSKDHWERETKARADYELKPKYVVTALSNIPKEDEIAEAVEMGKGGLDAIEKNFLGGVKPGKYAIIMNAAERNLQQILFQEQPEIDDVRVILRQVFESVNHLHDQNLMHGDIKMSNIVRFRIDNKLRLIDFDASARIAKLGEAKSFAGAKFSSAILPPEMIERIVSDEKLEKFKEYWMTENDKVLPEKVKPKQYEKAHYVVKSYRTEDGEPVEGLPYELVHASSSIDAWSLGVLAFTLLAGESLIPSTFVDDCASGEAMHALYNWGMQPQRLSELFQRKIHDDAARNLVSQLLQYEPEKRPSISELLQRHPFFNTQSVVLLDKIKDMDTEMKESRALLEKMHANILAIKKLGDESKAELFYTRSALLKAIFEATEVNTPTTFIVLGKELPAPVDSSDATGSEILDLIAELGWKVADGDNDSAFDTIKKGIKGLTVREEMYLYLVDELTGEPVRAKGWPLKITKPSELVPKLLPLMMIGMRGLSICNGAAGLARIFFPGVPRVPEKVLKRARETVELLKQESSVEEFAAVHKEVKGGTEEKKSVRGVSLREFEDFLNKNDPGLKEGKSGDFAGLQRIGDPEDGTALWTLLTDPEDIENALKKRVEQRKKEESEQRKEVEQLKEEVEKRKKEESEQRKEVEQRKEEVEQLKHNMHTNDTVKKKVEAEGGEKNEVDSSSRMPVEYPKEIAKLIETVAIAAAKEAATAAVKEATEAASASAASSSAAASPGNACCAIL